MKTGNRGLLDQRGGSGKTKCELCESNLNQYTPACLRCGGRYLRAIQRHPGRTADWLRNALTDWMAHGHSEQRLRELAKQGPARE